MRICLIIGGLFCTIQQGSLLFHCCLDTFQFVRTLTESAYNDGHGAMDKVLIIMEKVASFHQPSPTSGMSLAVAVGVPPEQQGSGIWEQKRWYIAVVMHNTEKACCKKLNEKYMANGHMTLDFETYVPSQRELRVWRNGRRKKVDRILIPTYIFIYCTETVRKTIKQEADFIKNFMKDRAGQPDTFGIHPFAFIPDSQMLSLQRMVGDAETPITIDPSQLHVGAKVRVKGGRLMGLEGNVLREPGGKTSIALCIDFLGCAKTEIPLELLEMVE